MDASVDAAMRELAAKRPVFHSKSDWQFALAIQLQRQHHDADIRLEITLPTKPKPATLDI